MGVVSTLLFVKSFVIEKGSRWWVANRVEAQ